MTDNARKNRRVRVGVCGVGSLGEHHARLYAELPEADLVGVYDARPERAREIATRYGVRSFDSLESLAAAVEAVSVVVPTDLHHAVGRRLLEAGLHLLVEKPIAATLAEAEDLVALAAQRGLILQVGHVEHFNPVLAALDKFSVPPRYIEARRLAPYPPPRPNGQRPRGTEVSVVLDLMIHDLDIILQIVRAPVTDVHATGVAVLSPTEDIANARIAFANGTVANVTASRIHPERLRKIRLYYPDAYATLDYMNQSGVIHRRSANSIEHTPIPIQRQEPLRLELAAFLCSVRDQTPPPVSGERATDALRLSLDILRQIAETHG